MNPSEDPTSIGAILLNMGAVTQAQLEEVIKEQRRLREDALVGRLLIARGYCTHAEFNAAMDAQQSMRNGNKEKHALAVADISLARTRRDSIIQTRERIIKKGRECLHRITTEEHIITDGMLAKKS